MQRSGKTSHLLAVAITLFVLIGACSGDGPTDAPLATSAPTAEGTGQVVPVSHAEPSIKELESNQRTLFVSVGADITWTNDDGVTHTVTSNQGWFNQQVEPGGTFSWQPTRTGIYRYHCEIHDNIQGTIVVSPGGAVAPVYYQGRSIPQYFSDSCGGCHGPNREGGTGPALIPGRLTADDDFYFDAIKEGRPGTVMPAWGKLGLSDEEVWGLVGFMRSKPEASTLEWTKEQIAGSLIVLLDEAKLPGSPQHDGNMDNLMLVTERENRSIVVIDGDSHTLPGHIPASYRGHGDAFDPTNERWAYNVGRDGWVFKIDLHAHQAVRQSGSDTTLVD